MSQNKDVQPNTNQPAEDNKITVAESEKLKELVNNVKILEQASKDAVEGGSAAGGTPVEDENLDRAKRQVDSYTHYLSGKYKEPPETFITNLETQEKAAKEAEAEREKAAKNPEAKPGESGTPEKPAVTNTKTHSPDVANF